MPWSASPRGLCCSSLHHLWASASLGHVSSGQGGAWGPAAPGLHLDLAAHALLRPASLCRPPSACQVGTVVRTTWSGERLREDTARLALLAPVPCLTHSTAPLCARPPFSCHLPMLCLLESKDFPGGEALQWKALPSSWHALSPDLPAVGSTLGRQPSLAGFGFPWWEKCTAPGGPFPVPAVPAASPSRAEGGQLPGSLFQKGWRAGPAASACDTPALGTLFSPRPQQGQSAQSAPSLSPRTAAAPPGILGSARRG